MPRYVVLRHEVPESFPRPSHWDLMLEVEDGLLTWSLPRTPEPGHYAAESLAHHRKSYLDYRRQRSQPIAAAFDAGTAETSTGLSRNDDRLVVRLRGQRLQGTMTLQRTGTGQTWQLTFASDEAASSGGGAPPGTETNGSGGSTRLTESLDQSSANR